MNNFKINQNSLKGYSFNNSVLSEKKINFEENSDLSNDENEIEYEKQTEWTRKPDFWSDDARMNALFAPFRSRDLNPLHYDNKLKFWKDAIISFSNEKNLLRLDLNHLESCFTRKNIKPKCLEFVLNEMKAQGLIKTREEILMPKPGVLYNMFTKIVWSPLSWSASYVLKQTPLSSFVSKPKIASYSTPSMCSSNPNTSLSASIASELSQKISSGEENESFFVNTDLIESKSNDLMQIFFENVVYRNVDCVIEFEKACDMAKKLLENDTNKFIEKDVDLLIKYLEVNKKILISKPADRKLIKFSLNRSYSVAPLTQMELSYINLKATEEKLETEANKLSEQIENLNNEIKTNLKQNNKTVALKLLKKRKQLEKSLETKDSTLANIQGMIMSIQQADTNQITYDVYSKSAEALKEANKGIKLDKLDDTIADIQDFIYANNEIEEAIKSPVNNKYNFDESELNIELNELLANNENPIVKNKKIDQEDNDSFNLSEILESLPKINAVTPGKKKIAE